MPTGEATAADRELLTRLAKMGVTVTVRQLQSWRRLGLIEGPIVVRRGRLGTESTGYPEGTELEVAKVHFMLERCHNINMVVLALFGIGVNPTEKALRDAYKWYLDRVESHDLRALTLANESHSAYSQFVRRYASEIGEVVAEIPERWKRSAKERAKAESQIDYLSTGKPEKVSSRVVRERDLEGLMESLVHGEGDPSGFLSVMGFSESDLDEFESLGGMPTITILRRGVDSTTYADLVSMRDEILSSWMDLHLEGMPMPMQLLLNRLSEDDPMTFGYAMASSILSAREFRQRVEEYNELEGEVFKQGS